MPPRFAPYIYIFLLLTCNISLFAQNTYSNQFSPEINITSKPFNKSTIGFDLYTSREPYTDTTISLGYQSSIGGKVWFNHYFKSKIKTSFFFEPIYFRPNPTTEDAGKMEYRFAAQNVYYSPFKRWTLQNRIRFEDRILQNSSEKYVNAVRLRYLIKGIIGINKTVLIDGTIYLLASNEVMLNLGSSATGYNYFERNIIQLGIGYCISDYINLETVYAYTINLKPNDSLLFINALTLTLTFNNVFTANYLQGYFSKKSKQ